MSVTVVSCIYGDSHDDFLSGWCEAISELDPEPDAVIIAADRERDIPHDIGYLVGDCPWLHPQAFYLNLAISAAETEWVLLSDMDDRLFPYALAGLERVRADVWQMGFMRSDGEVYTPPAITGAEYLGQPGNPYTGSSSIRVEAFREVGGFLDVAFQDWSLWRRLALNGASFQTSGRAHYEYNLHDRSRSSTELTRSRREFHKSEMLDGEVALHA